jgi:hypothetical protein
LEFHPTGKELNETGFELVLKKLYDGNLFEVGEK